MLLYRPEYYDPSSADRGVAEVILAKNITIRLAWREAIVSFGPLAQRVEV